MSALEVLEAARKIIARDPQQPSTHYADCYLYHLTCFARFVLEAEGQS